jgi:hypothetical protein
MIVGVFWFLISILDWDWGRRIGGDGEKERRRKYKIREVKREK